MKKIETIYPWIEKLCADEQWRTDPLELMPYWRMAGDALRWRKVCWALGDFFNNLGNL